MLSNHKEFLDKHDDLSNLKTINSHELAKQKAALCLYGHTL